MAKDQSSIRKVAVIGGVRLPFCRAGTNYSEVSNLELLVASLSALVERYQLKGKKVDEVALGTVFFHPSTWNMAREAVLQSGLSPESPGLGIQRACATSLDAAIDVANKIALGKIEVAIAGGTESISNVSVFYQQRLARRIMTTAQAKDWKTRMGAWKGIKLAELKPASPATVEYTTKKSMGQHCELMAQQWEITREDEDELSLKSHQNGIMGYETGFYQDLVVPFQGVKRDNNLRADTSLDKLAKLKPVFDRSNRGTLTAGNSSPLTDGAGCVLLASEAWAKANGQEVLAYLSDYQSAAVDIQKEGLLMAPAYAVPPLLERNGLKLQDFDFYEVHEAFAAQVLCTLKAWESDEFCRRAGQKQALGVIDRSKLNVRGGSVALGHPFGATGARLISTAAKLLKEKGTGRSLLSICTGGGMGTAAILER